MRLVRKLTLAIVAAMCVVLAVHAYLRVERETALHETDMRRDHFKVGRAFAIAVAEAWRIGGQTHALDLIKEANRAEEQVLIRWVWLDAPAGDPYHPTLSPKKIEPARGGQQVILMHVDAATDDRRLYTYIPVPLDNRPAGALELSESFAPAGRYVRTTIARTVATTVLLVAVCALVAMALGTWFVGRPVSGLIAHARRVGAGDFTTRLALRQRDEIGDLAREMNAMSDQLQHANERLTAETAARISALEQLRHAERLATVGKLAAGIAHELGTPLNVLCGRAKMIASGEVSGDESRRDAEIVVEQAGRMTTIIRQLLDFARRRSPTKAPQDLWHIVRQTTNLLEPLATKSSVAFSLNGDTSPAIADVDGAQLQQALTNLVVNAVQAMPRGGKLTLGIERCRARPPATHGDGASWDCFCLFVQDEGEGMPASVVDHVFEPFFTTKEVGDGTGLGLSVSYGIVHEHGGWLDVQSRPGVGSRFSIYLRAEEHT